MGAGISRAYAGGEGSTKSQGNCHRVKGLRNRRRATWAREKFVADLRQKQAEERQERLDLMNQEWDEIYGSSDN